VFKKPDHHLPCQKDMNSPLDKIPRKKREGGREPGALGFNMWGEMMEKLPPARGDGYACLPALLAGRIDLTVADAAAKIRPREDKEEGKKQKKFCGAEIRAGRNRELIRPNVERTRRRLHETTKKEKKYNAPCRGEQGPWEAGPPLT